MSTIAWLEDLDYRFPPVEHALTEPDGLLAVGGFLQPEILLDAYRHGIFPWYSEGQPILWWSPDPRCVLFPEQLKISRSLRKNLNKGLYEIKENTAFRDVMQACAEPRRRQSGTWITAEMVNAYCRMHELGYAHSIECWRDGNLVGGLYGMRIGDMFFGESMFSRETDASKLALVHLCTHIQPRLIDVQVYSDHMASLGAEMIPRERFIHYVEEYCGSGDGQVENLQVRE
jgi:leucyl/phenylalanyl-tRNA--protein transferase